MQDVGTPCGQRHIRVTQVKDSRQRHEGKTKVVTANSPLEAVIFQKDDITAGDGVRRHQIPGKGELAARTTANVFRYLDRNGINTHFLDFVPPNEMLVRPCKMLPVEVVVRRIPYGSYLKRHPYSKESFETPLVEYYLKDDANHDPQISYERVEAMTVFAKQIPVVATEVFLLLEKAWVSLDITLVDLKIEFGEY